MRPEPKWLFGTWSMPPHCVPFETVTFGLAVCCSTCRVAAVSRASGGRADHNRATTPATCGAAIEVPLRAAYALPGIDERTLAPGATTSGFRRPEPSAVTGPGC